MKMKIFLTFALFSFISGAVNGQVSLQYGESEGRVAYSNAKNHPNEEELLPIGPLSFRVHDKEFWVLDSLAGKILRISPAGKLLSTITVTFQPIGMLEDFALVNEPGQKVNSILVLQAESQEIVKIGLDGKILKKIGGRGEEPGKFTQFHRIEVSPNGEIAVSDKAKQTLALLSADGKLIREVHWEWSGFCFDPAGDICRLKWDETLQVNYLLIETPSGKKIKEFALAIGPHTNPDLWFVGKDGEAVLSYIPQEGFKGKYGVAKCDPSGKPIIVQDLVPPIAMNRFFVQAEPGNFFLAAANYDLAPEGSFKIQPYTLK